MPTTGTVNSKLMRFYYNGNAITCATDATLSMTNETRETTCKDSGQWKEFLYAQSTWEASGSANLAFDATNGIDELMPLALAQTVSQIVFQTGVTGDSKWTGDILWTNISISSPGTNENVTFSFTGLGTGSLTAGTS